ncbi:MULTISPECIES: DUF421 domain-containing protein [unclassified Arthrobacter]|uniref:DUF421 domain-containing protein n=1 Tax=unclassified Arthrobacter TaxID=235627 RepID=UPI001CE2E020|nr:MULTISPECIES: hypothetical protein [unclassified Arthrobacter]
MWFESWEQVVRVLIIGSVSYAALVLVLRASGKRTLGQLNAFDFIVTVALGSTLATILLSADVTFAQGITALVLLATLQFIVAWLSARWPWVRSLVTAKPVALVIDGELSGAFWRKNWWQLIFLLVPFLRFFRALQAFRLIRVARFARFGGILSAGIRGSRSAGRLLSSRIGWLAAVTAVVILAASQLLYATGSHESYTEALFEASMATITGTGITPTDHFARILQVLLAIYSVAVFATLAGSLGAFFLRDQSPVVDGTGATPPADQPGIAVDR